MIEIKKFIRLRKIQYLKALKKFEEEYAMYPYEVIYI